jgi:hypothetical protein
VHSLVFLIALFLLKEQLLELAIEIELTLVAVGAVLFREINAVLTDVLTQLPASLLL